MANELSLFEILHGHPDPRAPDRDAFLRLIGREDTEAWRLVVETMAAHIAAAIHEERKHVLRRDIRERCEDIAEAAGQLIRALTNSHGEQELIDAFAAFAPARAKGPDDVSGLTYIAELKERAQKVAESIRAGPGKDTILATLGQPRSRQLCAAMVREVLHQTKGRAHGDKHPHALEACALLWKAAGGPTPTSQSSTDLSGSWERHLKEARTDTDTTATVARSIARSCLALAAEHRR